MAKPGQHKRRPSAREFSASDAYNRLIYIIQNTETMSDAARRLGRSTRTLRRWKSEGIPDRSLQKTDISKKLSRVSGGFKSQETRQEKHHQKNQKELKVTFYERNYGGAIVRHYPVDKLPYEALLEILMMECKRQPKTVAYSFLLRFEAPFEGLWDGKETFISADELSLMPKSEAKAARESMSWINVTMDDPFTSSKLLAFKNNETGNICLRDDFGDILNRFFFMKYTKIYEIRVKQRRTWTDEQDETEYDY